MQSLQHQNEETATLTYRPFPTTAEPGLAQEEAFQAETEHHALVRNGIAVLPATLSTKIRREALQRDRYEEITRAAERAQMPVTQALESGDANIRWSAAQSVLSLSWTLQEIAEKKRREEEIQEMMAQLLHETREARFRRRQQNLKTILVALFLLVAYSRIGNQLFHFWWMVFPLSGVMAADRLAYRRREAARMLGEARDPRAVGVLAVALRDSHPTVREMAAQSLFQLLPRVRASDAPFIDADQMEALLAIAYHTEIDLRLELLQALEQIGDARAIPAVHHMQLYGSREVREQAEACLPFLLERERRARESVTLLRAASANTLSPDQLLRPAADQDRTPPDQLLRSSASQ